MVAGYGGEDFLEPLLLARYENDGSLDGGFGNGGIASAPFSGFTTVAYAATFQGDGRIVAAGKMLDAGWDGNVAPARFEGDSSALFADGFESGDTSQWSATVP